MVLSCIYIESKLHLYCIYVASELHLTVRGHPNMEDFPKFGEIANFKIGEFPQIWGNGHFSILFLEGKEFSQYAVIIHVRALIWGEYFVTLWFSYLSLEKELIEENLFIPGKIPPNLGKFFKFGVNFLVSIFLQIWGNSLYLNGCDSKKYYTSGEGYINTNIST